jgi:hypothetical protein
MFVAGTITKCSRMGQFVVLVQDFDSMCALVFPGMLAERLTDDQYAAGKPLPASRSK